MVWEFIKRLSPDATTQTAREYVQPLATPPLLDVNFLDWLRKALALPHVEWRTFRSTWKGWHYVKFSEVYTEPPSVVAICSGFYYDLPTIPPLPEWTRPDYADVYRRNFAEWFRGVAGDWGVLNWLRDGLAAYFLGPIGWVVGFANNVMWDLTIKPHADAWNKQIIQQFNTALKDVQEKMLNLTQGLGVTPIAAKNITTTGCDVFSPQDTDVHMIVAGV